MNNDRKMEAQNIRVSTAGFAYYHEHPDHVANRDEQSFRSDDGKKPSYISSLTKGLLHRK